MFTKKYIFETKTTRTKRILQSVLIGSFVSFVSFILLCIYLPIFAENQNEISEQAFFQRSPDVIAVFTGDIGRISHTFKKAEKYPSAKIFITGVYSKNNLEILLKKQGKNISVDEYLEEESHHIELDYLARNTIENSLATIHYLSKIPNAKNILIVSSDYHIFRISRILNALNDDSNIQFYYESIPSNYHLQRNLKKLIKEVYKFFKTSTFLLFWDRETQILN